jgi:hypothetical protein
MRGARRTLGVAPMKKSAATSDKVLAMVAGAERGLIGKRDRALLLLGFALAARRSELVALDVADLEECPEGLRVTIRRSKTDQEGAGAVVAVCRGSIACPVAAVRDWLAAAGISDGPLFRRVGKGGRLLAARLHPQNVALIVKTNAARLGLDPSAFSGHSLRSGFLTSAAARGTSLFNIHGREPPSVGRHSARPCMRCEFVPGSRGGECCRDESWDRVLSEPSRSTSTSCETSSQRLRHVRSWRKETFEAAGRGRVLTQAV